MNRFDLEHILQMGENLYFEGLPTYKVTLADMVRFGFTKAQGIINILCMDDLKAAEYMPENGDITTYHMMVFHILTEIKAINASQIPSHLLENTLLFSIPSFLSLVFRQKVSFHPDSLSFLIENSSVSIHSDNFDALRTILKERNCLAGLNDEGDEHPADARAKALLEKRRLAREKLKAKKLEQGQGDSVTMADLISIFAEAQHLPLQEVYENYDIYQFNNQFNRLRIMDDYHINLQMLMAGAKKEDVKLTHYITKIK